MATECPLPGGRTITLGGGTAISGGGTPDTGGGTPFRPVPAEFIHWSVCVSVRNFHAEYLGTKRFRGSCPIADAHGASIDDVIDDVT